MTDVTKFSKITYVNEIDNVNSDIDWQDCAIH